MNAINYLALAMNYLALVIINYLALAINYLALSIKYLALGIIDYLALAMNYLALGGGQLEPNSCTCIPKKQTSMPSISSNAKIALAMYGKLSAISALLPSGPTTTSTPSFLTSLYSLELTK